MALGPPDRAHNSTGRHDPRLPTGCRFWIRSGTTDRQVFVERAPVAADDRVRQPASRQRADHLSARRAVRRLRRLDDRRTDRGDCPRTSGRPIASLDATLFVHPAEHERRWDRLPRIGPGERASVGERVDALIGAFWASRFNQDLRRHPLPFSGGFRPGHPAPGAIRSPPCLCNTTPTGGPSARSRADGRAGDHRSAGRDPLRKNRRTPTSADPGWTEVRPMPSLRDHLLRTRRSAIGTSAPGWLPLSASGRHRCPIDSSRRPH